MANYYQKEDKTEFFRTPDWIVEECYKMIPRAKTILDPCAGDCGLEDFLRDVEYTLLDLVPRSSVIQKADFLNWTTDRKFDAAICNPPFGLKNEFIEHLFEFTDEIVLIAPLKSIINDWYAHIKDIYLNWRIPFFGFGILTSVAIFHLTKESNGMTKEEVKQKYLLPEVTGMDIITVYEKHHLKLNKWGLYVPITKANIVRNNELLREEYIFEPGDDSIFIAKKASINNQAGDKVYRHIIYTDTQEDALAIIQKYKENDEYVRNYAYQYGNNILDLRYVPALVHDIYKIHSLF